MKKRNIWKAALTLCLIGAFCLLLSFFLAGGTPKAYANMLSDNDYRSNFEERSYETDEPVREIRVSDTMYGIWITPSQDATTRVRYTESEHDGYDVKFQDGALTIEYHQDPPHFFWFSFSLKEPDRTVTIELPPETLTLLKASCVSANLDVTGLSVDGDAILETVNGDIRANDMRINGNLTASNTNGGTKAVGITVKGSILADTVNGKVRLEDCESGDAIRTETTNGSIDLENVKANGELCAETVNGTVRLKDAAGGSVSLSSVNGDIDAELTGSATAYAWNTQARDGQTPVTTSTVNGSVRVTFTE